MQKTSKKIISVFLSLLMVFSCVSVLGGVISFDASASGGTAVSSLRCVYSGVYDNNSTLTVSGIQDGTDHYDNGDGSQNFYLGGVRVSDARTHTASIGHKYADYRLYKTVPSLGMTLSFNNIASVSLCSINLVTSQVYGDEYGNYFDGNNTNGNYHGGVNSSWTIQGGNLPSVGDKTMHFQSYNAVYGCYDLYGCPYANDARNDIYIYIHMHDTTALYNELYGQNSTTPGIVAAGSAYYSATSWNNAAAAYDVAVGRVTNTVNQNEINTALANFQTAKANLDPNFAIQYQNEDGSNFGNAVSYNYPAENNVLRADYPSKTGYTFAGWVYGTGTYQPSTYIPKAFGTAADGGTIYLKASFVPNNYTINFNSNGGTCATTSKGLSYTDSYTLPTATKDGYTFTGWANPSGSIVDSPAQGLVAANNGSIELTAQWDENSYGYTYNLNGGTGAEGVDYTGDTVKYESENITLPAAPSKTGYHFLGWNLGSGDPVAAGTPVNKLTNIKGVTVEINAAWDDNTYTVAFDSDGGSDVAPINNQKYSATFSLPEGPTKAGYTFNGWKYNGTVCAVGAEFSKLSADSGTTVTFKADWTENTYTLKLYDPHTEEYYMFGENDYTTLNYTQITTLPTLNETGYSFTSWKNTTTNSTYTGDVSMLATSGEITLTAQWTLNEYTITPPETQTNYTLTLDETTTTYLDADAVDFTVVVDEAYNRNPLNVTATNCTLVDNGSGSYTIKNAYGDVVISVSDQTTINSYDVTFVDDDGETVLRDTQKVNHGSLALLPEQDPSKPEKVVEGQTIRYSFIGWKDSNTGKTVKEIDKYTITNDTTFTAVYEEGVFYTLTFKSQDGTTQLQKTYVKQGENEKFKGTRPIKADTLQYDYTLVGWATSANQTAKTYDVTEEITPTSDMILYAAFSQTTQTYSLSMPTPVNFTIGTPEGMDISAVPYNTEVEITVTLDKAYDRSNITFRANAGTLTGVNNNGVFTYVYKAGENVTLPTNPAEQVNTAVTFAVEGVEKNVYTATIPTGTGYEIVDEGDVLRTAIEDGKSYSFKVKLAEGYDRSEVVVKNGETTITPNASGVYTIANVKDDIKGLSVTGVKLNEYKVTFNNHNGDKITEKTVTHGGKVVYDKETPIHDKEQQYYYVFKGWALNSTAFDLTNDVVTDDITLVAAYDIGGLNKYRVNYKVEGVVAKYYDIEYGAGVEYDGEEPIKASDAQYDYSFKGWDKTDVKVYDNMDINAEFNKTIRSYTVTFMNGTEKMAEYQVAYGNGATYGEATPEKASDATNHYTFDKWSKDYSNITGNLTVDAEFTSEEHTLKEVRQEASCAVDGYIRQVCEKCGYIKNETPLVASGHTWSEWAITTEATHTKTGRRERTCSCGATDVETINKLPDHTFVVVSTDEAKCTKDGLIVRACECGATEEQVIPKLGHLCDDWTVTEEPKCTTAGSRNGFCVRCQKEFEEYIEPLGHQFGEYSKNENGTQSRTCETCGYVETTLIPADPVTPIEEEATEFVKFWRNVFSWVAESIDSIGIIVEKMKEMFK